MNVLSTEKKSEILMHLVEGLSIRSIERITGFNRRTILRVLTECGEKAKEILDSEIVNLQSNFVQVDEIHSYVAKRQKNLTDGEKNNPEIGEQYVFVAMDSETKLVTSFGVGKRTYEMAHAIMKDLQYRIGNRFQLSTDSFAPYFNAVDSVFGEDIDYGQVHKEYAEPFKSEKRYSPAEIVRVIIRPLTGSPNRKYISTSHIERQNLTMRMSMRRFTRLTNAFSKKLENHKAAVALHFFHYNFMRIHQTLRVTPAMEARITNRLWNWSDLLTWNEQKIAA